MTDMEVNRPKVVNDCGCMQCRFCDLVLAANGIYISPPKPPPPPADLGKPVENPAKQKSLFSEVE